MFINFHSWETIALFNLFITAFVPFLIPQRDIGKTFWIKFLFLLFFLQMAGLLQFWLKREGDIRFFLILSFLHFNISFTNSVFIWKMIHVRRPALAYYLLILLSGFLSLLGFVLYPTMTIADPFWGVLPGTVLMDPIISLKIYWARLGVSTLGWFFILIIPFFRKTPLFGILFTYWVSLWIWGQAFPSPLYSERALKKGFVEYASVGPFEVWVENPKKSAFSADIWAKDFEFNLNQIKKRLPPTASISRQEKYKIFIFESDQSKASTIGARNVQIGDFYNSEMFLSLDGPHQEILPHELSHLLHGHLSSPLRSYVDPFLFEGFAIALSSPELKETEEKAAAILIENPSITGWPRFLKFTMSSSAVSYALAGGSAAKQIRMGKLPWEALEFSVDDFRKIPVSERARNEARELLKIKPFFRDTVRRDCARLYRIVEEKKSYASWKSFQSICPYSTKLYTSVFEMSEDLNTKMKALESLRILEANGDLAVLREKFSDAIAIYKNCEAVSCEYKQTLLRRPDGPQVLKRILTESKHPYRSLLQTFIREEKAVLLLLESADWLDKIDYYLALEGIRPLTETERLDRDRLLFYRSLMRGQKNSREIAKTLYKIWKPSKLSQAQNFQDRLLWEVREEKY